MQTLEPKSINDLVEDWIITHGQFVGDIDLIGYFEEVSAYLFWQWQLVMSMPQVRAE